MKEKIQTTIDNLNQSVKEIETVWHGGIVEGFDEAPTA